jgi:hypothetical protein
MSRGGLLGSLVAQRDLVRPGDGASLDGSQSLAETLASLPQELERVGQGTLRSIADRDLSTGGVEVELFGEKARVAAGPAALAVQTGAALMPVTLWFEGEKWRGHIHPEIPVPEHGAPAQKVAAMTQQLAAVWAADIAQHPRRLAHAAESVRRRPGRRPAAPGLRGGRERGTCEQPVREMSNAGLDAWEHA